MKDNNEDDLMKIMFMFLIVLYSVLTELIFKFVAKFVVNLKKKNNYWIIVMLNNLKQNYSKENQVDSFITNTG